MKKNKIVVWIIAIIIASYIIIKFSLLYWGKGVDDMYFSTGSRYHIGRCFFVDGDNVEETFGSKKETVEAELKPCWLCVHNNDE